MQNNNKPSRNNNNNNNNNNNDDMNIRLNYIKLHDRSKYNTGTNTNTHTKTRTRIQTIILCVLILVFCFILQIDAIGCEAKNEDIGTHTKSTNISVESVKTSGSGVEVGKIMLSTPSAIEQQKIITSQDVITRFSEYVRNYYVVEKVVNEDNIYYANVLRFKVISEQKISSNKTCVYNVQVYRDKVKASNILNGSYNGYNGYNILQNSCNNASNNANNNVNNTKNSNSSSLSSISSSPAISNAVSNTVLNAQFSNPLTIPYLTNDQAQRQYYLYSNLYSNSSLILPNSDADLDCDEEYNTYNINDTDTYTPPIDLKVGELDSQAEAFGRKCKELWVSEGIKFISSVDNTTTSPSITTTPAISWLELQDKGIAPKKVIVMIESAENSELVLGYYECEM